jgi:hypothetical protein
VLAGLNTRGRGSNRGEPRAGLGPAAGRHPAAVRVSGAGAPLPDGTDSHRRTCPTRSRGHRGRPRGLLALLALDGQAFRLLRSWAINSPRWPPTREAGELDPNVDPTVALVAIHALVVGHTLFRAQFARELWIEPDDLDDRLAMVATRLFGGLNQVCGQPRDSGAPGDRQPLLAGPDRLEHARIQQGRRVAELAAFGDVTQQPAHDLAAAGLGHLWDHVDLPRASDR